MSTFCCIFFFLYLHTFYFNQKLNVQTILHSIALKIIKNKYSDLSWQ